MLPQVAATQAVHNMSFIWAILMLIMLFASMDMSWGFKAWRRYLTAGLAMTGIVVTILVMQQVWRLSVVDLFHIGSADLLGDTRWQDKLQALMILVTLASPLILLRTLADINKAVRDRDRPPYLTPQQGEVADGQTGNTGTQ